MQVVLSRVACHSCVQRHTSVHISVAMASAHADMHMHALQEQQDQHTHTAHTHTQVDTAHTRTHTHTHKLTQHTHTHYMYMSSTLAGPLPLGLTREAFSIRTSYMKTSQRCNTTSSTRRDNRQLANTNSTYVLLVYNTIPIKLPCIKYSMYSWYSYVLLVCTLGMYS